jgi:hypothetical protein
MVPEVKRVLITVKAYPNPSKKYGETVCAAGIDLDTNQWIRLYPIPFRDLDEDKKFKKYTVIEVSATKAVDDNRPESFKVDSDSIKIIDSYDTKDKWERRKKYILPTVAESFCNLLAESKSSDKSLGIFKPLHVDFTYQKARPKDKNSRDVCYSQLGFYDKIKKAIEPIPLDFRYSFSCCSNKDCKGHNLSIIDWEIGEAYRAWKWQYRDENTLLAKIKERWLHRMFSDKNDTYFFVGNMKRFREHFMVLGVFYPPKTSTA